MYHAATLHDTINKLPSAAHRFMLPVLIFCIMSADGHFYKGVLL
jgi:hypothetical protein